MQTAMLDIAPPAYHARPRVCHGTLRAGGAHYPGSATNPVGDGELTISSRRIHESLPGSVPAWQGSSAIPSLCIGQQKNCGGLKLCGKESGPVGLDLGIFQT